MNDSDYAEAFDRMVENARRSYQRMIEQPTPETQPMPTETKPFGVYVKTFAEASHGVSQGCPSGNGLMKINSITSKRVEFQSNDVRPNSRDHFMYIAKIEKNCNGMEFAIVEDNNKSYRLWPLKDDNTPAIAPKAQKPTGRSLGAKLVSGIGMLIKIATMSLLGVGVGKLYRDVDALRQYVYRSGHEIDRIQAEMADLKPPLMAKPKP